MIILDLEASGSPPDKVGIWQLAALDSDNPKNIFFEECRIDDEDIVEDIALKLCGKTELELRDKKKQSQKQMLSNFFAWTKTVKIKNFLSQCPFILDFPILRFKADKYKIENTFFPNNYRTFDLHSIAQTIHYKINKRFLFRENSSDMGLGNIQRFCGIKDERIQISLGKVVKQGSPHNALEDTKIQAECFSRLIHGKNLLPDFEKFPIPEYLLK